jgi:spectinomycin phosphotransferase/16S rRNA (guanine(1405)-N(7))-methyltransferase
VTGGDGTRWFATVDELVTKRQTWSEPLDAVLGRLRAALGAAHALRSAGLGFVVAPVPNCDGDVAGRLGDGLAIALYPFVEGEPFGWGEFSSLEHRHAVLQMLTAVHRCTSAAAIAPRDDFLIPLRDELEAAIDVDADVPDYGPYAHATSELLTRNSTSVRRWLDHYDGLVSAARATPFVLTHGEPHPGNTIRSDDGWVLVDWDTARMAPPERDLWSLDSRDGSVLRAYAEATGVTPDRDVLDLYRQRWDLADLAVDVARFRRPHTDSADDNKTWEILTELIERIRR